MTQKKSARIQQEDAHMQASTSILKNSTIRPLYFVPKLFLIMVLMAVFSFLYGYKLGYTADAKTEQKKAEAKKADVPQKFNIGDFVYVSENKRDPFEPLYLLKMKQDRIDSVSKRGYELEELKFVGVLKTEKARYAMMEDMQGRGITFKKGDFINNNLWVLEIVDDRIILGYRLKGNIMKIGIDILRK